MNALSYAINKIKMIDIPTEILNIAFTEYNTFGNRMFSLDEKIISTFVRPVVLVDMNVVGGVHLTVSLDRCNLRDLNEREYIVEVPKNVVGGASILSALSITTGPMLNYGASNLGSSSQLLNAGETTMDNMSEGSVMQTARLQVIGENTILVQDVAAIRLTGGSLRLVVTNNDNLENITTRAYPAFKHLVMLGLRAYIYNYVKVKMDKGYIYSGHELGIIKETISEWNDASTMYEEYLRGTWAKIAYINNKQSMSRSVSSMIGNSL